MTTRWSQALPAALTPSRRRVLVPKFDAGETCLTDASATGVNESVEVPPPPGTVTVTLLLGWETLPAAPRATTW